MAFMQMVIMQMAIMQMVALCSPARPSPQWTLHQKALLGRVIVEHLISSRTFRVQNTVVL